MKIFIDILNEIGAYAIPAHCTRFPGITADARELGVNRVTLYKMLAGYPGFAGLKTLRKRYTTLKRRQATSQRRTAA